MFECAIDEWNLEKGRWDHGDPEITTDDLSKAEKWLEEDVDPNILADLEPNRYRKVIREVGRDSDGERVYNIESKRNFVVVKREIRE